MAIALTHLGEIIVQRIACESGKQFCSLCKIQIEPGHSPSPFIEARLLPYSNIEFDGCSRVDMVLDVGRTRAAAFEIKLGTTRLTKSRINDECLSDCSLSHCSRRFAGNMMSILERKFPSDLPVDELCVKTDHGSKYILEHKWYLVVRSAILSSWKNSGFPAFSDRVSVIAFEDIVELVGEHHFNKIVSDIVRIDYYSEWVKKNAESAPRD